MDTFADNKELSKVRKLYHMVIGFEYVKEFEYGHQLTKQKKVVNEIMRELSKALKYDLKYIQIQDVTEKGNCELFVHYHIAILPITKRGVFTKLYKTAVMVREAMLDKMQKRKSNIYIYY
jgi:hypothetical protein